ncbi:T9SS type A sorting domain-containing protein [Flavobacterium sp. LMO8]|uniref:T9SS type A sorting domain-containing protein n=1 Tax=Flavobacterium sp. LMO8 TaxID=2654244 RepID=UPI001291B111|nr:T9SS type A sorting domain-containing protein [Flavobacterium sp. LMO8]MQP25664.1 T9SS type A sorting domain-containing protein [Flavobacterium sp. LMO8]
MKKITLLLLLTVPFLTFSQIWDFTSSNQDWTKKGSGQYVVAAAGTTAGNLHLSVTGTTTTNNFFSLENLVSNINTPLINYKFLRVKLTNSSVVETMTFRADATNPAGANKSVSITPNSAVNTEYFIDLTGITWGTGMAGTYELRFQKPGTSSWATSQFIAIDEIEFMTDVIKNDHIFDIEDNWVGETNASNGTSVSLVGGKLIVTPNGGINAKIINNYYSIDATDKFIHIIYKNNSTVNNSLRVNYFSPTDSYVVQKTFPNQNILLNGAEGEMIIDASSVPDWTGNIRKLSVVLTYYDGVVEVPTTVDAGTLEIDRIVINNNSSPLSEESNNLIQDFYVYPNPAENKIFVNSSFEIEKVEIYSLTGQLVKSQMVSNNINISDLNSGIYLAKVQTADKVSTIKFIKK